MPKVKTYTTYAGNTGVIIEGQKFRQKYKRKNGTSVWVCIKDKCSAKAETNAEHHLINIGLHNHAVTCDETLNQVDAAATNQCPAVSPPPENLNKVEFITTSKGKQAVLHDAFLFYRYKIRNNSTIWRCSKCRNKLKTRDGCLLSQPKPHSHEPLETSIIHLLRIKEKLRVTSIAQPDEKPSHLIADCLHKGNPLMHNDVIRLLNWPRWLMMGVS